MEKERGNLSAAEWQVMECLWERAPQTGREVVERLGAQVGWSRSTVLTLLRRLEAKGAVAIGNRDGVKTFAPAVAREDAAVRETEDLLSRVYRGSVSMMVSALTRKQSLSREELSALHKLLDGLEAEEK